VRENERDNTSGVSEKQDKDMEELIRELQENIPEQFFRNTNDKSKTEQ
jgi:hypothetical protein